MEKLTLQSADELRAINFLGSALRGERYPIICLPAPSAHRKLFA
jgi:hypothetical protein